MLSVCRSSWADPVCRSTRRSVSPDVELTAGSRYLIMDAHVLLTRVGRQFVPLPSHW